MFSASGRNITVCTLSNGLEILNGSIVNLASCETCSCGEKELSCCGVGALAGIAPTPPEHCKTIRDGCKNVMVLKADETRDCTTGKSILLPSHPLYSLQNMYDMAQQQYMGTNNMIQGPQMANVAPQQFFRSQQFTRSNTGAGNMILANHSEVAAGVAPQMSPVVKHYFDRNVVHPDSYDPYFNSLGNDPYYNSLGNDPYYNSLGNMLYPNTMFN
ncbi:unnamed protein product [Mytilus coruscus]|uniref:Uncharacterized protein n=1 Tax=Mytilus coruscus TaxID=42192 RepID=A0A6J8EDF6_MYTCO|nr:unnamed protein product [Mytilus coruscus]